MFKSSSVPQSTSATSPSPEVPASVGIFDSMRSSQPTEVSTPPSTPEINEEAPAEAELAEVAAEAETSEGVPAQDGNVMEVKGNGKLHKFTLDKNDKKLQQTLAYGLAAPKLQQDNKAMKKELEQMKGQLASAGDVGKYSMATELASAGHIASSIREFLGEETYNKFYNEEIIARLDYENASPEEQKTILTARHNKEKEEWKWRNEHNQKGKDGAKQQSAEAIAKETEDGLARAGVAVLQSYDFTKLDKDPAAQELLKDKLWKLAFDDVEEWATSRGGSTPTKAHIEKAFARNYKLLTGARASGNSAKVSQPASGNKAAAKTAAENYDKGSKKDDFKGSSPLDFFNRMRN